jgi:transitional endoplasmic reticulum ATPase
MAKRASDLLSKYVGDNERNIARMFRQATEQDAVLVLDEADSFLADRQHALHSWEVTLVNEMLTQMESFPGIFIATTNLDSHLDTASSRRFVMKVRFDWLTPEQGWQLFQRELMRLGGRLEDAAVWEPKIRQLRTLAPGDFAVLARQSSLWGEPVTAASLYEGLYRECQAKRQTGTGSIGFVTG